MRIILDRNSAMSVRQQLRSAIEHEIAFGGKAVGDPLPPVRDLAEQLGVAPVTVSKVYAELKAEGLIAPRPGSGTYVADSPLTRVADNSQMPLLRRELDAVIDLAVTLGCSPTTILSMITARVTQRLRPTAPRRVVMLGLFSDATASYARAVQDQVGHLASVEPLTLDMLGADPDLRSRVHAADLVLTFANLEGDTDRLLPGARVLSLRFIPSVATRLALAAIDPMRRVGLVSRFPDFLPILNLGVRRFAPHLEIVASMTLDDPGLATALGSCDTLVLSTGAEASAQHARRDALTIEYRHVPDPSDVDRRVIPRLVPSDLPSGRDIKEAS